MDRANIGEARAPSSLVEADPRLQELEYLRKGEGLTRARLLHRPGLLRLVGASDADEAFVRIADAARLLSGGEKGKALAAALALDADPGMRVADRRRDFARRVGRSLATVRRWEDDALAELLVLLRSRHQALPDIPMPPFLLTLVGSAYRYRGRHYVASRQIREVVSLVAAAPWFRWGSSEPVAMSRVKGAIHELESRGQNGEVHKFTFPSVLSLGEPHRFEFSEARPPGTRPPDYETVADMAAQTFETPTARAVVEVQFEDEVPEVVWAFTQLHRYERPGTPAQGEVLTPNEQGRVRAEFRGLYGGFGSGIAWRWPKH